MQQCPRCSYHFSKPLLGLSPCLHAGGLIAKHSHWWHFPLFPQLGVPGSLSFPLNFLRLCQSHPKCLDEFPDPGNFVIAFNGDTNTSSDFIKIRCFLAELGCYYQTIHKQQRNQFMQYLFSITQPHICAQN